VADSEKVLRELEARAERSDPRFARGLDAGRPCPPREYRRDPARAVPAVAVLAVSLAALAAGAVLGDGLLLVTGLVMAGAAAHLCTAGHERGASRSRLP
jgi:DUF3040 family protein